SRCMDWAATRTPCCAGRPLIWLKRVATSSSARWDTTPPDGMARLRRWPAALAERAAVSAWVVHVVVVRVDPVVPVARREAPRDLAVLRAADLAQPLAARVARA